MKTTTKKSFAMVVIFSLCTIVLAGCDEEENKADKQQQHDTEQRLLEAYKEVGMPDITKFTELKLARDIMELRDKENISTYTYLVTMHGKLVFLGESIGYGLPYSVQFSNPKKHVSSSREIGHLVMPQAEPNGLFMPEGLSATWILLKDPKTGKARTVYVESEITVSPFPLHHVNEKNAEEPVNK
jgi:hypothetical protein